MTTDQPCPRMNLDRWYEIGSSAWPEILLTQACFSDYLSRTLPEDCPQVPEPRIEHLYLACACLEGNQHAMRAFEEILRQRVIPTLRKLRVGNAEVEDVMAELRGRLLIGTEERPPRLADYRGMGDIGKWASVAGLRLALNRQRGKVKDHPLEDAVVNEVSNHGNPHMVYLKRRYGLELKEALRQSIRDLTPQERNMLRFSFVEGLTQSEIGKLLQVDRSTVSRRIDHTCTRLFAMTKEHLTARLRLTTVEFESIVREVVSECGESVRRMLAK